MLKHLSLPLREKSRILCLLRTGLRILLLLESVANVEAQVLWTMFRTRMWRSKWSKEREKNCLFRLCQFWSKQLERKAKLCKKKTKRGTLESQSLLNEWLTDTLNGSERLTDEENSAKSQANKCISLTLCSLTAEWQSDYRCERLPLLVFFF